MGPDVGAINTVPAGPLTVADFVNPPSPISSTSSTAANVNTDSEGGVGSAPHNETTIAVNPTNSLNLIGSANDFQIMSTGGLNFVTTAFSRAHVTFDGGHTWTTYPIDFHGYVVTGDPAVAFDADGTAYLATLGFVFSQTVASSPSTSPDVLVAHSTDGGKSWSGPVRVASGSGSAVSAGTLLDKEYVAAWGHGNAIVTYTEYNQGAGGSFISAPIVASVTHDGGNTWTAPVPISGPSAGFLFSVPGTPAAVPTVAADGSIYVAFMSQGEEVAPEFRDHYQVVKVDPSTGQPVGTPVEVGLVFDGIHDYPINVNGAETYQDSEFRTNPTGDITADPTNAKHLAVVWSDMRNNPGGLLTSTDPYQVKTNSDIIVSQSFDGGQTWSAPAALAILNDQFMPWAAYSPSGLLQIGYYDRSYDPANHRYGYTLASEKKAGALKFTFQQLTTQLSDPTQGDAWFSTTVNSNFPHATTFMGDYCGIAVSPAGVDALWTDMRVSSTFLGSSPFVFPGSNGDVFFADPPAAGSGAAPAPALSLASQRLSAESALAVILSDGLEGRSFLSPYLAGVPASAQAAAVTQSLGGTAGQAYGVTVSADGLGAGSFNFDSNGAAFGVENNTARNVYELRKAVDRQAVNGVLYKCDKTLRNEANDLFDSLNKTGVI